MESFRKKHLSVTLFWITCLYQGWCCCICHGCEPLFCSVHPHCICYLPVHRLACYQIGCCCACTQVILLYLAITPEHKWDSLRHFFKVKMCKLLFMEGRLYAGVAKIYRQHDLSVHRFSIHVSAKTMKSVLFLLGYCRVHSIHQSVWCMLRHNTNASAVHVARENVGIVVLSAIHSQA